MFVFEAFIEMSGNITDYIDLIVGLTITPLGSISQLKWEKKLNTVMAHSHLVPKSPYQMSKFTWLNGKYMYILAS